MIEKNSECTDSYYVNEIKYHNDFIYMFTKSKNIALTNNDNHVQAFIIRNIQVCKSFQLNIITRKNNYIIAVWTYLHHNHLIKLMNNNLVTAITKFNIEFYKSFVYGKLARQSFDNQTRGKRLLDFAHSDIASATTDIANAITMMGRPVAWVF